MPTADTKHVHRRLTEISQAGMARSHREVLMPNPPMTSPALSNTSSNGAGRSGSARILVVDDEKSITDLLSMALRYEGMEVQVAHFGREALEAITAYRPDLIVLDVMLPDLSGFDVLERMGRDGIGGRVPVLFLTARDTLDDKLRGFTLGGDDYMTKPFSVEELIVRVRAILRRAGSTVENGRLGVGDLSLDEESHQVFRGQTPIELTPTEFKLLHYLLLNTGRVVSKSQILDRVWNYDFDGNANVVEIYVSYLRKKIDSLGPPLIHTVRGVGYSLRRPAESS